MEESLELYTCSASSRDSEMPEYARNGTVPRSYNELATLMSVTGEIELLISHLQCSLSTGTAGLLGSKVGTAHSKNILSSYSLWLRLSVMILLRLGSAPASASCFFWRSLMAKDVLETEHDWWTAGEDSIKHLLSRGTHREFGYAALVVMLVFYFAGAVWAAGSAIASGLFVPMLLIGSCIGRIVGLMAVDFAAAGGHGSHGYASGFKSNACHSKQRAECCTTTLCMLLLM